LGDAVKLAEYLHHIGRQPEQVQDFYPTPGTLSTCMYYTGIDPRTMKPVYVPRTAHEKALQRALLQWMRPEKKRLVVEALNGAGRTDLIGYGKRCLIKPLNPQGAGSQSRPSAPQAKQPAKKFDQKAGQKLAKHRRSDKKF
jgi:radical SAM superfamily enzyme YgiQ (UPF0313 family)